MQYVTIFRLLIMKWIPGHLLTSDGDSCSPECDIIIRQRGHVREWNGRDQPVMHFKFIDCKDAIAVISCKSVITSVDKEHRTYIKALKPYVDKIFIFAECCEPSAVKRLKRSAQAAGCDGFWYLYACDKMKQCIKDPREWREDFLTTLEKLVDVAHRGKNLKWLETSKGYNAAWEEAAKLVTSKNFHGLRLICPKCRRQGTVFSKWVKGRLSNRFWFAITTVMGLSGFAN